MNRAGYLHKVCPCFDCSCMVGPGKVEEGM